MKGHDAADDVEVDEEMGKEWPTREIQEIARQREFYQVNGCSIRFCCCCL